MLKRQEHQFTDAYIHFTDMEKHLEKQKLTSHELLEAQNKLNHQKGISLIRLGNSKGDCDVVQKGKKIMLGKVNEAELILGEYEDIDKLILLTDARKSILFRINTLRFIKTKHLELSFKNFKRGVLLANNMGFLHELEQLKIIYDSNLKLKSYVPDQFDVFNPCWN